MAVYFSQNDINPDDENAINGAVDNIDISIEYKDCLLYTSSPNALDGNNESKLDSASAKFQAEAGVVDFTGDEETIANGVRQLVSMLPANNEEDAAVSATTDDLNRACPDMAAEIADPALALSDIADDNVFVEVKASYAKEIDVYKRQSYTLPLTVIV